MPRLRFSGAGGFNRRVASGLPSRQQRARGYINEVNTGIIGARAPASQYNKVQIDKVKRARDVLRNPGPQVEQGLSDDLGLRPIPAHKSPPKDAMVQPDDGALVAMRELAHIAPGAIRDAIDSRLSSLAHRALDMWPEDTGNSRSKLDITVRQFGMGEVVVSFRSGAPYTLFIKSKKRRHPDTATEPINKKGKTGGTFSPWRALVDRHVRAVTVEMANDLARLLGGR